MVSFFNPCFTVLVGAHSARFKFGLSTSLIFHLRVFLKKLRLFLVERLARVLLLRFFSMSSPNRAWVALSTSKIFLELCLAAVNDDFI